MSTFKQTGYESPVIFSLDLTSEGVLCSSFQDISKEFDYIFGEDEE